MVGYTVKSAYILLQRYCEHNSVSAELLRAFKVFVERFGSIEIHGF